MTTIAILGTGEMGARMAKKLLDTGHAVTVFNRTAHKTRPLVAAGARFAATPIEAVENAQIAISMVTDDNASRAIWLSQSNGALHGLANDAVAIESSTLSLGHITDLSNAFHNRGIAFLDAPVIGSRPQADAGQLIFLAGGDPVVVDNVTPVLSCMATAVHSTGTATTGIRMKLAVNALFSIQVAALSELVGLLEKGDIRPADTIELLNQLPITSPALQGIGQLIRQNDFSPRFPITLVAKDLQYTLHMSHTHASETPLTAITRRVFHHALQRNLHDQNIHSIVQLYCGHIEPLRLNPQNNDDPQP